MCARPSETPKVGAECPNWARSDLCGGRPVMDVPTAKISAESPAAYGENALFDPRAIGERARPMQGRGFPSFVACLSKTIQTV